jgi:hypothetical protein
VKYKYLFLCFILSFLCCFPGSYGQEFKNAVSSQNNVWLILLNNPKLNEKWGYTMEAQIRRTDFFLNPRQVLFRTGIDHYLSHNTSFTAGYAFISTGPFGKQSEAGVNNEQRFWQQVMMNSQTGKLSFNHRYRLEQRWVERYNMEKDELPLSQGYNYLNRFCYRLLAQFPLNQPLREKNTIFLTMFNEVFINFENIGRNILFDQNRAYAGLGYRFSAKSSIQIGYLNQTVIEVNGKRSENNNIIQLLLSYNLLRNS